MDKVYKKISQIAKYVTLNEPVIFDLSKIVDGRKIIQLLDEGSIHQVSDDYVGQLKELFSISNPALVYQPGFGKKFEDFLQITEMKLPLFKQGRWVFFPWLLTLVHILEEKDFQMVRTARNCYLISPKEQKVFYNAVVGIGGLSIGNSVALTIVLQGGARHIKLADFDKLALSNTNRIRAGMQNLGLAKVEMTARQIYEINPYAKIDIFSDGLNPKNIEEFFEGLDIVIDELDDIAVKFLIREQAKKHKLPVVMAADNGDNAVVDIERYDLDPQPKFFHGRIGKVNYEQLKNLNKFEIGQIITKHIGPENVTKKMQQSLLEMGKTVVSWPQLGGTALLNGSTVAYCVRRILNNQPLENNRALISLDEKLIPNYNNLEEIEKRRGVAENFKKVFKL